ncbi:hypothetical protein AAU61_17085 [Desulfocarbo indianensis]|nr:hypothetical protein AAU61_17085 [Desulfocarbo indianensis]
MDTKLGAYCEGKVPPHVRDKLRIAYRIRGNSVTVFEERPRWDKPDSEEWTSLPIAQFRYDPGTNKWTLYCADRNGRWHKYDLANPVKNIETLIAKVEEDRTGIFWG